MRRILFGAVLAVAFSPLTAFGEMFAVEIGPGIRDSDRSDFIAFRYRDDLTSVGDWMGFYEYSVSRWDGPTDNTAVQGGLGLRYHWPKEYYFSATAGLGYVAHETEHMGTHFQFHFRFALGQRFDPYDVSVAYVHYSNGKGIFGWSGPNVGEDFVTVQVGYHF